MNGECNLCGGNICSGHTLETPLEDVSKDIIDDALYSVFPSGHEIKADKYGDIQVCEECYNRVQNVCIACGRHGVTSFASCPKCRDGVCSTCLGAERCWKCVKGDDISFQKFLVKRLAVGSFKEVLTEYESRLRAGRSAGE